METAAIILGLAALGGVTMAGMRLNGRPRPPTGLALAHGALAAVGLLVLLYHAATVGAPSTALAAIGAFVVAALGGAVLFFGFHLRSKPLPIPFVLGHGLIGAVGYALLLTAIFRGS